MKPGICPWCKKRNNCRFRQPGTWVVECEEFEPRPVLMPSGSLRPGSGDPEEEETEDEPRA